MRSARWLLPALLLIAFPASFASAHRLKVFGFAEGTAIHGSVYFSGNVAAQGARIQVFDPGGALLAETTSDDEGRFTITARRRVDHRIVADSGDGHRAEYAVPAHELPPALPGPATSAPSGAAPADLTASPVGSIRPRRRRRRWSSGRSPGKSVPCANSWTSSRTGCAGTTCWAAWVTSSA